MVPVRTCVGCRQRANRSDLLRITEVSGELLPNPKGSGVGRGAWLHTSGKCLTKALETNAFARSFKCRIIRVDRVQHHIEQAEMMLASNE